MMPGYTLLALLALRSLLVAVPTPVRYPGEVEDAYALRFNPAGLGALTGSDIRILYGRDLPDTVLTPEGTFRSEATNGISALGATHIAGVGSFATGFEVDFAPSGKTAEVFSLGGGFGGPRTFVGLSFEHRSPVEGPARDLWSSGILIRPAWWASVGLHVRDLGQQAGRRNYDLGLAVRPFSERALLSTRWRLTQGQEVFGDRQDLAARVEIEPLEGILLGAGVNYVRRSPNDDELGVFGQLALSLEGLSVGTSVEDTTSGTAITAELAYRTVPRPSVLSKSRVALIELEGELTPEPSFNLLSQGFEITPYGAVPLLFEEVARSDRVYGAYVRISSLSVGWAKAEELRSGIQRIRSTGRRVDCELAQGGDLEYFVASACSSIIMSPPGTLEINGIAANVLFFADGLDRLGVSVDAVARGRYKSTPEQLTRSGMSAAQQEALGAYVDEVYAKLVDAITSGRSMTRDAAQAILGRGTVTATEALSAKLVDAVLYPDEIDEHMNRTYGRTVSYVGALDVARAERPAWSARPRIAIVHVDAPITGGESKNLPFGLGQTSGAETVAGALEAARLDPSVAAVVLRVDSPGGDSFASDLIARAVHLLDEEKPVIASFGDTAASGGYYVASQARMIYAEPTSLTGSIGVFSIRVSIERLLAKLGINGDAIERGAISNAGNIYSDMKPEEREAMERQVDQAYRQFLEVVARGRARKLEEIREVAEGRIWSGRAAREKGLVDELGGLVDALRRARLEAGIGPEVSVDLVTLPSNREPLPAALRRAARAALFDPEASAATLGDLFPHGFDRALKGVLGRLPSISSEQPIALLPYVVDID